MEYQDAQDLSADQLEQIRADIEPFLDQQTTPLVHVVCDALFRHEIWPKSWKQVREFTNKGSSADIQRALNQWREQQFRRLKQRPIDFLPADPVLHSAAREFFSQLANHLSHKADQRWMAERDAAQSHAATLASTIQSQADEIARLAAEIQSLQTAIDRADFLATEQGLRLREKTEQVAKLEVSLQQATNQYREDRQSLQNALQAKDQTIADQEKDLSKARKDMHEFRSWAMMELDRARDEKKIAMQRLSKIFDANEIMTAQITGLTAEHHALASKAAQLEAQNQLLAEQLSRECAHNSEAHQTIQSLQEQNKAINMNWVETQTKLTTLVGRLHEAQQSVLDCESARQLLLQELARYKTTSTGAAIKTSLSDPHKE